MFDSSAALRAACGSLSPLRSDLPTAEPSGEGDTDRHRRPQRGALARKANTSDRRAHNSPRMTCASLLLSVLQIRTATEKVACGSSLSLDKNATISTSPVSYPCLLSEWFLPAKRISRRYAESPEGTGIRSTGPLGNLFISVFLQIGYRLWHQLARIL